MTGPDVDRKVYDSDIRAADDYAGRFSLLRDLAHTYCREYVGNFDLMIEARTLLARDGRLPEGLYRPVLNTLRTDPNRQDLWGAVRSLLGIQSTTPERDATVTPIRPTVRAQERHYMLDVRVSFKHPLVQSAPSGMSRRVLHRPDPSRSWIRWERPEMPGRSHARDIDRPMVPAGVWVAKLCGGHIHDPLFHAEPPDGMDMCRHCECLFRGYEYPQDLHKLDEEAQ